MQALSELFKCKLEQLGYRVAEYSLSSLHAGVVMTAANAAVPDCLFKRHGCWKSESAKDGYVDNSVESRLTVTKSLGL